MTTMKKDKLDAMIMLSAHTLAEKNVSDLHFAAHTDFKMPDSVERKIKSMISKEHHKFEYAPLMHYAKHVVLVLLVICTTSFAFIMSMAPVRSAAWDTIVQWYDDYIAVAYTVVETPPLFIEEKREPTAIPEDWEKTIVLETKSIYYVQYMYNNKAIMYFKQKVLDRDEDWIDNERAEIESIMIGDNKGYLMRLDDKDYCYFVWNDGMYSYTIQYVTSEIEFASVLRIAESIS
ncbi:MAG: DUF4367 domain-containing protein [Clostridia bacterium]|nr:DUF4367 domain-containing protein [Clostridia bacterium]